MFYEAELNICTHIQKSKVHYSITVNPFGKKNLHEKHPIVELPYNQTVYYNTFIIIYMIYGKITFQGAVKKIGAFESCLEVFFILFSKKKLDLNRS